VAMAARLADAAWAVTVLATAALRVGRRVALRPRFCCQESRMRVVVLAVLTLVQQLRLAFPWEQQWAVVVWAQCGQP
jgi:hypothetical protein